MAQHISSFNLLFMNAMVNINNIRDEDVFKCVAAGYFTHAIRKLNDDAGLTNNNHAYYTSASSGKTLINWRRQSPAEIRGLSQWAVYVSAHASHGQCIVTTPPVPIELDWIVKYSPNFYKKCHALAHQTATESKFYTLNLGESDALFPTPAARERFEKKHDCTVVIDASGVMVRAPKNNADLAFLAFYKLRQAVHGRKLVEVRQMDVGGNVALLCGAGLEVLDLLCDNETALVAVSNIPANTPDEYDDEEVFRDFFIPDNYDSKVPTITFERDENNPDRTTATLTCASRGDAALLYYVLHNHSVLRRLGCTVAYSQSAAGTVAIAEAACGIEIIRRDQICEASWIATAAGGLELPPAFAHDSVEKVAVAVERKGNNPRQYAYIDGQFPAGSMFDTNHFGRSLQQRMCPLLMIVLPAEVGTSMGDEVMEELAAVTKGAECKILPTVDVNSRNGNKKNSSKYTIIVAGDDSAIEAAEKYMKNEFVFVSHRVESVKRDTGALIDVFSRLTGANGTRQLGGLFTEFRSKKTTEKINKDKDADKGKHGAQVKFKSKLPVWAEINHKANSIDMYGSAACCNAMRAKLQELVTKFADFAWVDNRIEIKSTAKASDVEQLLKKSKVESIYSGKTQNASRNDIYLVSGSNTNVSNLKEALESRDMLDTTQKTDALTGNECLTYCGDEVLRQNLGMASSVCNHVACHDCLPHVVNQLKQNGCNCCAAGCKAKLPLRDIPIAAFGPGEFEAMLRWARDKYLLKNKDAFVKCPTNTCPEIQRANALAPAGTLFT